MAWMPASGTRRRWAVPGLLIATLAVPLVVNACGGGSSSLDVNDLRNSDAPYYYVGEAFDGLMISHVERYQSAVATFTYGSCQARSDEGCAPPLELQHRLCRGTVTIVIFANERRAARAADALRPLSRGANAQRPEIALNRSPQCSP